jgi:CO/xanthine dehydrogenase Mo-binding subunit
MSTNVKSDAVARVLTESEISRRSFLRGTGLVIGMTMAAGAASSAANALNNPNALDASHTGAVPGPPNATQIDSWLQVNPDNTVTLFHGVPELGQGTPTAVRQIAAEELGLSMEQVTAAQLDTNVSISAFAVGSGSARNAMGATNMRGAAAAARTALLELASEQLGVPVSSLKVDKGVVSGGGKTVKYGDLMAGKLFKSTIAAQSATLTDPKQFKVIGKRVPRIDIPNIVNGRATFIHNVRVPGMLHGRVVRPFGQGSVDQGAKLLSVNEKSIKNIEGAQVVVVGNFVGVVAPKEWAAIQAASQLEVKWDDTPKLSGSGNLASWLKDPANLAGDAVAAQSGNIGTGIAGAAKVVQESYFTAYQAHVPIGPNCAVADVRGDQATVLCMAQGPYTTRSAIAGALKLPATSVRDQIYQGSSSYGHGTYDDASISAALLSQAVGKPVRVQFMRWDDHGWDQFGPAQVTDIRAGIDASGKIVAYDYASWQHGWTQVVESATQLAGVTSIPATAPNGNADATSAASYYAIPNRRVTSKRVNGYNGFFKGIWLRAPAAPQSLFASEQMIDALAYEAKLDPIAFRI